MAYKTQSHFLEETLKEMFNRPSLYISCNKIHSTLQGEDQGPAWESQTRDWNPKPDQQPTDCQVPCRLRELEWDRDHHRNSIRRRIIWQVVLRHHEGPHIAVWGCAELWPRSSRSPSRTAPSTSGRSVAVWSTFTRQSVISMGEIFALETFQ